MEKHLVNNKDNVIVRPYAARDRAAVRRLCFETGDIGESVEYFFKDLELFADLWTQYYTDVEPESSWVAESEGTIVGYLNGCLNNRRFKFSMIFRIVPMSILKSLGRGTLFKPFIWTILSQNLRVWMNRASTVYASQKDFTGHFHINLKQGHRGQHIGSRLMSLFLVKAKQSRVAGVSAGIREDNGPARAFFEKEGFVKIEEHAAFYIPGRANPIVKAMLYGKKLNS